MKQVRLFQFAKMARFEPFMDMWLLVQTIKFSFILCIPMFAYDKHANIYIYMDFFYPPDLPYQGLRFLRS